MLTFQKLIAQLSNFWEKKGCVIHQGHDLEVGAGTFNPATFLRCLGPEPYNTAYVEPSRRPQDGRYGENPNRVQLFHQYQVILKPSPPEVQKWYLESLEAIGLDLKKHDIRFVHSDWESPSIGAWGLGWEVWCDGMEISQFTYFQAIASLPLNPISAEITYGLERLAMYIQNVDNIFDLQWNDTLTFRDISHASEIEWSVYNFSEASTEMWQRHFNDFEKEAKTLIARHLPIPAYDFVIKASHAFNMLDARGVISATERTGYIGRIRDLARLIGIEYVASREKLGYPLLKKEKPVKKKTVSPSKISKTFNPKKRADFLLEIGSEELPESFVPIGVRNLERAIRGLLQEEELSFEEVNVFGSPRRLAVLVKGLVEGTESKKLEKRGPPVSLCFDSSGKLTQQGEGFLKSCNLSASSLSSIRSGKVKGLEIRTIKEQDYLFAEIPVHGKSTMQILAHTLPTLILNIDFPKKMRWGTSEISYARPLQWIAALFAAHVIPFSVGEHLSGRYSFGHSQLKPQKLILKDAKSYVATLKKGFVLVDIEERKKSILKQLDLIEKKVHGIALEKERVLNDVLYLVEWPKLTFASFATDFLRAPQEVLISEMVHHQKYFPLADRNGKLKNQFVITADNTPSELIRKGNQKVLSARLSDGVFLYEQDLKAPLENFNEKLGVMTFQKEMGSMLNKVMRLTKHVKILNRVLAIADDKKALRAALLSKADLASALVGEFPELQGTAGRYYALAQKEEREVADALEEQWMPKQEGAPLPKTPSGIILSLADKVDNLLGYFSVGLKPTSSSDPFALRRQTFGLIKILVDNEKSVDLQKLFAECSFEFPSFNADILEEILHFVVSRAKTVFEEYGFKKDEVEAVLRATHFDPFDQYMKVKALHQFRKRPEFGKLFEVYKRAKGQLAKSAESPFDPALLQEGAEKTLYHHIEDLQKNWKQTLQDKRYTSAFDHIAKLQPHLAHLFDTVKILADDPTLRNNRIALLQKVFSYFEELLDFSKIQEVK
jgi:glycyl-tRNA synthetase